MCSVIVSSVPPSRSESCQVMLGTVRLAGEWAVLEESPGFEPKDLPLVLVRFALVLASMDDRAAHRPIRSGVDPEGPLLDQLGRRQGFPDACRGGVDRDRATSIGDGGVDISTAMPGGSFFVPN